jgi:hypothetical protein
MKSSAEVAPTPARMMASALVDKAPAGAARVERVDDNLSLQSSCMWGCRQQALRQGATCSVQRVQHQGDQPWALVPPDMVHCLPPPALLSVAGQAPRNAVDGLWVWVGQLEQKILLSQYVALTV